jgi:hypothetical protein
VTSRDIYVVSSETGPYTCRVGCLVTVSQVTILDPDVGVKVVHRRCIKQSIGMATDRQDVQGYKIVIKVIRKGAINDMK